MRMRMRGTIIAAAFLLGATSAVAVGAQASGPPASAPGTASEGFG